MFGISDYPALVLATLVFLALPGPGTIALLTATSHGGWRGGAAATFGLMVADQVLLWLAVGGVAAALEIRPALFRGLQVVGALYLAWIGLSLIFRRASSATTAAPPPRRRHATQAFLITLLNPKALLFYVAFVPLFIDPLRHQGVQTFAAIAVTIALITAVYCLSLCAVAEQLSDWFRARPAAGRWLQRTAGVTLLGFSARLLS